MSSPSAPPPTYAATARFVLHYWLRAPRLFALLIVTRVISNLIDASVPLATGALIDAVASGAASRPEAAYAAIAVLIAAILAFQTLRNVVAVALNEMTLVGMTALVRDAFGRVQRFSADWHADAFAGATVRKITRGMWGFDVLTDTLVFGIAPAFIVVIGLSAQFLHRWPVMGLILAAGIAVFLLVSVGLSLHWVGPANARAQEYDSAISATLADSLTGNSVVKAFAAEAREDAGLAGVVAHWRRHTGAAWNRGVAAGLAQSGVLITLQVCLLGAGVYFWSRGEATPGDIAALVAAQGLINAYLRDMGQHVRNLQKSVNEMEDVVAFSATNPAIEDAPGAPALAVREGRIELQNVTFRYAGASAALYENFSLTIEPGQRVGLVGASGAGKSTFVKLIQRLHELDGGRILIDGQDIAQVTQASLRAALGTVAQEPVLFHRTLGQNIAYGRPEAAMADVREAARLAHADAFVAGLPKGYDTLVGERGVKLSGGERQRVAIARAVLAATPILVLDEATSSLDSVSELFIREALQRLSRGRTTLVIAHRLSTVQRLDRILVFDQGRIVEDGAHDDLVRRPGGVYQRLFETQQGGTKVQEVRLRGVGA